MISKELGMQEVKCSKFSRSTIHNNLRTLFNYDLELQFLFVFFSQLCICNLGIEEFQYIAFLTFFVFGRSMYKQQNNNTKNMHLGAFWGKKQWHNVKVQSVMSNVHNFSFNFASIKNDNYLEVTMIVNNK